MVPSERDRVFMYAIRKALGVVGLITPWNFPSAIPGWKLAPAILAGNTVILKPASVAPLSAWKIVEACHEAGVPKGVVNFVAGSGSELGEALVNAEPLKAISFTGSCQTGNWLHEQASRRRLRIQLEMGGKNPTIVLDDADLGKAVANTVNAAFFSTGQKCTATSRVIVEEGIYDPVRRSLGRGDQGPQGGRRPAGGHPDRTGHRRGAARHEHALHRDRQERGRQARMRRQPLDRR